MFYGLWEVSTSVKRLHMTGKTACAIAKLQKKKLRLLKLCVFFICSTYAVNLYYFVGQNTTMIYGDHVYLYTLVRLEYGVCPSLITLCFFSKSLCRPRNKEKEQRVQDRGEVLCLSIGVSSSTDDLSDH